MERWRSIPEFPGYDASNEGQIYNERIGRILKQTMNPQGQLVIGLEKDGTRRTRAVARLIGKVWVENRFGRIFDTIMHLDGDKKNCVADNLVWRPRWFAIQYHRQFESPPLTWGGRSIELIQTGEVFDSARPFSIKYGILEADIIQNIQSGGTRYTLPYQFRFRQT